MSQKLGAIEKNFFILDSETSSQVISSLSVTRGVPEKSELLTSLEASVESFPRSRCRLIRNEQGDFWEEDPNFSLENHLLFHEYLTVKSFDELLKEASTLFSLGLDFQRPLWCFHVLSSPHVEKAIVLFLIHHGFSDGGGGMEFVHSVCEPRVRGARERGRADQMRVLGKVEKPEKSAESSSSSSNKIVQPSGSNFLSSFFRAIREMSIRRLPFPFHGENSSRRQLSLLTFPVERARLIKDALGVSLNDVYLSYVAGAIRLVNQHYQLPPGARAFIPFNLRTRRQKRDFGNFLSAVPVNLPASEEDAIARTRFVHSETSQLKADGAYGAFGILGRFAASFPRSFRNRLIAAATRRGNFICTNVPSSKQRLVFAGAPVLESYGCAALLPAQGMSLGFMSYVDSVCISLVSDPLLVPEPQRILEALRESEEELFRSLSKIDFPQRQQKQI